MVYFLSFWVAQPARSSSAHRLVRPRRPRRYIAEATRLRDQRAPPGHCDFPWRLRRRGWRPAICRSAPVLVRKPPQPQRRDVCPKRSGCGACNKTRSCANMNRRRSPPAAAGTDSSWLARNDARGGELWSPHCSAPPRGTALRPALVRRVCSLVCSRRPLRCWRRLGQLRGRL